MARDNIVSTIRSWTVALSCVAMAVALRWVSSAYLGNEAPYLLLVPATLLVAALTSIAPTIVSSLAGALAIELLFYTPPDVVQGMVRAGVVVLLATYAAYIIRLIRREKDDDKGQLAKVANYVEHQAQLQESEQRFRATFDLAAIGMAHVAVDGRWLRVNDRLCEITGYTRQQLLQRTFMEITHPDDLNKDLELANQLRDDVIRHYQIEKRYLRPDGVPVWVNLTGSAVRNEDGSVAYYISAIEDVTWRKQAEEKLRENEAALKEAIAAAEAASRAKDRFLAMLSHELRTPLTPALTVASLLEKDDSLDSDHHESAAMIRRNIELEARLIDDLLDLTRVSNGKLSILRRPTSVHQTIRHVARICEEDIRLKQQKLDIHLDAENPIVDADPARLQQILWNVARNAVKFTPVGGRITVRTSNVRNRIRILIEDTGIGIAPEVLPRLFNAFEQGDPTVTRSYGGMGLGLSICKGLITLHGGSISVNSEGKDKGACFTIELPLASKSVDDTPGLFPLPAEVPAARLLLVEDHADTARVMSRLLREKGHDVQVAHCVADARKLIDAHKFDLLISDVGLPDGTGHDVMQLLRGVGTRGIALSGYGQREDVERSLAAGFHDHLVKPVAVDVLHATVVRVLGGDTQLAATQS